MTHHILTHTFVSLTALDITYERRTQSILCFLPSKPESKDAGLGGWKSKENRCGSKTPVPKLPSSRAASGVLI